MNPCALPAHAAVVVGIAGSADRDALFLVQAGSNHALIHGACTNAIDARSMRPGNPRASRD